MITYIILIAIGMFIVERIWPANELPKVEAWWARVVFVNVLQAGITLLAGYTWDQWLGAFSLFSLRDHLSLWGQAWVAYFVSTFVYYWWHRYRHESRFFWLLCHQLHHSPSRIELLTSFYKHPVEIALNSMISAVMVYTVLGCTVEAGLAYTFLTAIAEFFYHWNIKTPEWLGYIVQRPESHRIHHQYRHHTQNYADLPIWDMLFGSFANAKEPNIRCGYDSWREERFEDMLGFRDLHQKGMDKVSPLQLLPTCLGCRKRWACTSAAQSAPGELVTLGKQKTDDEISSEKSSEDLLH